MLKGISPIAANFGAGMLRIFDKLNTAKESTIITNVEIATVPIHPIGFTFQTKYVKTTVRNP
jgi:hypothetical protein